MFKKADKSEETTWLSLSDMMTVLMVLFMILAIFIALNATNTVNSIMTPISSFINNENKLCQKLKEELYSNFTKNDLKIACVVALC